MCVLETYVSICMTSVVAALTPAVFASQQHQLGERANDASLLVRVGARVEPDDGLPQGPGRHPAPVQPAGGRLEPRRLQGQRTPWTGLHRSSWYGRLIRVEHFVDWGLLIDVWGRHGVRQVCCPTFEWPELNSDIYVDS